MECADSLTIYLLSSVTFILSSVNRFDLDQSRILSFGRKLNALICPFLCICIYICRASNQI